MLTGNKITNLIYVWPVGQFYLNQINKSSLRLVLLLPPPPLTSTIGPLTRDGCRLLKYL